MKIILTVKQPNKQMITELLLVFVKSILAGISISFGGSLFTLSLWTANELNKKFETDDWTQFGQILGSVLFPVGLFIICSFKLDLFTGKVGLMFEQSQNALYFISLLVMLIGNIGSAVGFGLLIRLAFNSLNNFKTTIETISKNKYSLNDSNDYLKTVIQSILCGSCVHLAVKSFKSLHSSYQQLVILVWFIFMFVYAGFQHCIANCFYFACSHSYNHEVFINVCLVVIGNMFGTLPVSLITRDFVDIQKTDEKELSDM